jgi:hypothetical protein
MAEENSPPTSSLWRFLDHLVNDHDSDEDDDEYPNEEDAVVVQERDAAQNGVAGFLGGVVRFVQASALTVAAEIAALENEERWERQQFQSSGNLSEGVSASHQDDGDELKSGLIENLPRPSSVDQLGPLRRIDSQISSHCERLQNLSIEDRSTLKENNSRRSLLTPQESENSLVTTSDVAPIPLDDEDLVLIPRSGNSCGWSVSTPPSSMNSSGFVMVDSPTAS